MDKKINVDVVKESSIQYTGKENSYKVAIPAMISDLLKISKGERIRWTLKGEKLTIELIRKYG